MEPLPIQPVEDRLITYDAKGTVTNGLRDLWRGCAAFLVGGGPSINELPYHRLAERGIASLGINNVAGQVPVRAMTFSDPPEKFAHDIFADPAMMKLVPKPKLSRGETRIRTPEGFRFTGRKVNSYPNVWGYERRCWWTPETFLTDTGASWGNNNEGVKKTGRPKIMFTMFLGLRLLHFLGVRRVYLLGCDFWMNPAKGLNGNYSFPDAREAPKPEDVAGVIDGNNAHYRLANDMLTEVRPFMEAAGFEAFNCNSDSRLRAFDYVPFSEALEDCRNGVASQIDLAGYYRKGESDVVKAARADEHKTERKRAREERIRKRNERKASAAKKPSV